MPNDFQDLELVLIEFDRAHKESQQTDLSSWLKKVSDDQRDELLLELVKIDLEHSWKSGNSQTIDDYAAIHPQLGQSQLPDSDYCELFEAELEARQIVGKLPDKDELAARFSNLPDLITLAERFATKTEKRHATTATGRKSQLANATIIDGDPNAPASDTIKSIANFDRDLQPNDRIGHYILEQIIGQGSFASVWKASDTYLKRDVAIKVLKRERQGDRSLAERMLREARAAARLQHPNIVRVHEVVQRNDTIFIVSTFVDGPTLESAVHSRSLSQREAAMIVRQIALGLHDAHENGVIHRDIKPANILMNGAEPMIVDFGMAHLEFQNEATLTKHGDILGTPTFMAPEQARGDNHLVDPRTDVYSLGAILYRLVAGRAPFEGTVASVIHDVINTMPQSPRRMALLVDREIETIALKCLEKEPQDRYANARDLADDLGRYLRNEPIKARPASLAERLWKWTRRHPRIASLVAVVLVLGGFLLGSLLQLNSVREERDRAERAEQESRTLFANSAADAGRLAMQRGRMQQAVSLFRESFESGPHNIDHLRLDFIESLVAVRQLDAANQQLRRINDQQLDAADLARKTMWRAILAMETHATGSNTSDAIKLFEQASEMNQLVPGEDLFVKAMLARNSLVCIKLLRESLDHQPLNHKARRTLIMMLLSLGRWDESQREIQLSEQLFPGDVDFGLLDCLRLAAQQDLHLAEQRLGSFGLSPEERKQWVEALAFVEFVATDITHSDQSEYLFDDQTIAEAFQQFSRLLGPLLAERNFKFPPRIAIRFQRFNLAITDFLDSSTSAFDVKDALADLVDVHPEASLQVVMASQLLARQNSIEILEAALQLMTKATQSSAVVRESTEMACEARMVILIVLVHKTQPQPTTRYLRELIESLEKLEQFPQLVEKYSDAGRIGKFIGLLPQAMKRNLCGKQIALRWLDRYDRHADASLDHSLWIRMVVQQQAQDWIEVVKLCNQQLHRDPDNKLGYPNEDISRALEQAKQKIEQDTHFKLVPGRSPPANNSDG